MITRKRIPRNRVQPRNNLQAAFYKGAAAFRAASDWTDNPYLDHLKKDSRQVTWSRAYRIKWYEGWKSAKAHAQTQRENGSNGQ